jgi:predicted permease
MRSHAIRGIARQWRRTMMTRGRQALDDLDKDIRDHIERETLENIERGMPPEEARRRALLAFGNVGLTKEDTRAVWIRRWARDLRQDVRYAYRTLRRSPVLASVVFLTLAVGVGANTAMFSVAHAILLRTLPVERPHELVFVEGADGDGRAPSYPLFERLRGEQSSFTGMAAFATDELRLVVDGSVEQVFGQVASGSYFEVLGLDAAAGRLMTANDDLLDPPVAVIGYGYWQRRFGGAPDAIGRTVSFSDRVFTIVGVTPPEFQGLAPGRQVDVTLPITYNPGMLANASARWFSAVARLRPGMSAQQAAIQANAIHQRLIADLGLPAGRAQSQPPRVELAPAARGLDGLRRSFGMPVLAQTILGAILLLVACANIGVLMLVRSAARTREFAVRLATGAPRLRLVRQVLTETLALFVLGGAAAIVVAFAGIQALTSVFATGRRPILLDVQYDWMLVAFATVVTLASGLFSGLWPVLCALRSDPLAAMRSSSAGLIGLGRLPTMRTLVAGQLAMSLVLLVTALLFARTMANLRAVDLGFSASNVLTMSLQPELPRNPAAHEQFWTSVLQRVRDLPAVDSASLSVLTPLSGRNTGAVFGVPGLPPLGEVRLNPVSDGYFRVFGIERLDGRAFDRRDAADRPRVAVLNEAAAKIAFGTSSPIGERVQLGDSDVYEVVGVIRDHKHLSVREQSAPMAYVPLWQVGAPISRLTLSVSSKRPQSAIVPAVAGQVRAVNANTLVSDVIGVQEQLEATLLNERLASTLAKGFGALVLVLAIIGLYGIVSYWVAGRKAEFGLRLALGAPRSRIVSSVVRQALLPVAAGIVVGLPLALAVARMAERLLFGVAAADVASYAMATSALIVVACAAAWVPARRACGVDPSDALRWG